MARSEGWRWSAENELNLLMLAIAQNSGITLDQYVALQAWPSDGPQPTARGLKDRFNLLKKKAMAMTNDAVPKTPQKDPAASTKRKAAATTTTTNSADAVYNGTNDTGPNVIATTAGHNSSPFNRRLGVKPSSSKSTTKSRKRTTKPVSDEEEPSAESSNSHSDSEDPIQVPQLTNTAKKRTTPARRSKTPKRYNEDDGDNSSSTEQINGETNKKRRMMEKSNGSSNRDGEESGGDEDGNATDDEVFDIKAHRRREMAQEAKKGVSKRVPLDEGSEETEC